MKILIAFVMVIALIGCGDDTAVTPDSSTDAVAVVEASVPDAGTEGIITINDASPDATAAD